jgi:hypothetical protein
MRLAALEGDQLPVDEALTVPAAGVLRTVIAVEGLEARGLQRGAVAVEQIKLVDVRVDLALLGGGPARVGLDVEPVDAGGTDQGQRLGVGSALGVAVEPAHRVLDVGVDPGPSRLPWRQMPLSDHCVEDGLPALPAGVLASWSCLDTDDVVLAEAVVAGEFPIVDRI